MLKNNKGQIILLSVMILGGVMIGAATIGSFLLRLQINQVNDAAESTQALFAADAGIEAVSWCFFHEDECDAGQKGPDTFCPEDDSPLVNFENPDITLETVCNWDKDSNVVTISGQGYKGATTRILQTRYEGN